MATDYEDPRDERDDEPGEPREDRVIERAKKRVKTPAIVLLIVGVIGGGLALINIPGLFTLDAQFQQVEEQWDADPNLKPDQKKQMKQMLADLKGPIKIVLPMSIGCSVFSAGLIIFASIQIMKLKSRGLGYLASIVSMFPVLSGCCCFGFPVGIWVMLVLGNAEVKAGFAAVAGGTNFREE